jgi:hypothetical protein
MLRGRHFVRDLTREGAEMRFVLQKRPSPSTVIAFIALCVALAGTANALPGRNRVKKDDIARNAVRSRSIARNAVRSRHILKRNVTRSKIAKNSIDSGLVATDALTGADVLESSLATVPSAEKATNADRVNGRTTAKLLFRAPEGTPASNVLTLDGLTLSAACNLGTQLTLSATTAFSGATVHSGGTWSGSAPAEQDYYVEDDSFNTGESFDPLDDPVTGSTSLEGNLVYLRQDGEVVQVSYLAEEAAGQCIFAGSATG